MPRLVEAIEFRNPARARSDAAWLADNLPAELAAQARSLLASLPDPDEALHFLRRLGEQRPDAFTSLTSTVPLLGSLLTVFSFSNFLSEAVLRNPEWLADAASRKEPNGTVGAEQYVRRCREFLEGECQGAVTPLALARFRRRELLPIVLRDASGAASLPETTAEISALADAILRVTCQSIREEFARRHGEPLLEAGRPCGFSVIALGKLGGSELNYSSDIDLMFLYEGNGQTGGPDAISNKEFYKKVSNRYTEWLSTYTQEGICYRVDLRLRPDGRTGEVCLSLDGARNYYATRARDWELQMLIKARVAAGDANPGQTLLNSVQPRIYSSTLDFGAVEAVSATRERVSEKLSARKLDRDALDVKLSPGGIRDIEFLVQCLQRLHGGREPWIRHGGTMLALSRLRDKNLLSPTEYSRLAAAYQFLRHLEHRLQFDEDRQTHLLPKDPAKLEVLARKMPFDLAWPEPECALRPRVEAYLHSVRQLYERVIHAQQPVYYGAESGARGAPAGESAEPQAASGPATSNLRRFLDQRAPALAEALPAGGSGRAHLRLEHFLELVLPNAPLLDLLDRGPELVRGLVDLFRVSPFLGDQLLREPELLRELAAPLPPGEWPAPELAGGRASLRRFFRSRMFGIQSRGLLRPAPVFEILAQTSDVADFVIRAAYRNAVRSAGQTHPPAGARYAPENQMLVIALGRLGMREFDLGSDADLVFVLPDADQGEIQFWTAVAEHLISDIEAYTGDGALFSVDTRLRADGRDGALVQTAGAYKEYFAVRAEAWEGIAYMKARVVAGDAAAGNEFLHQLQAVDWRRYGQNGRSRKEIAQMRTRLEKEQAARNPLKAGHGGFYDIDFALLFLRLKGAGIFYPVLNTPERIDVVEQMGHLDMEDADFLRDASCLFRAVDHALRVTSGQADGRLPESEAQLETLSTLVARWAPGYRQERPLQAQLDAIRDRTRGLFDQLFR